MYRTFAAVVAGALLASAPALADDFDFKGSFGPSGGFTTYVPAISNPLFNETPYIDTEVRALYLHQEVPDKFLTQGGSIDLGAVEFRIALTDRLAIIAPKDGYGHINFNKGLKSTDGFANLAFGLKYAAVVDPADNGILSVGFTYEPPSGDLITSGVRLQGSGSGFLNLFVTGAKRWGKFGLQGDVGVNVALDGDHDSSLVHFAGHADYEILPDVFPVVEVNGWSVYSSGKRLPIDFEGSDLVNVGTTRGGTVITVAEGVRCVIGPHVVVGLTYEEAVTNRKDLFDTRFLADVVLKY